MRKFLGSILAIPLKILFAVMSIIPVFSTAWLCRLIWKVSGSKEYSEKLVVLTWNSEGPAAARQVAETVLQRNRDSNIAAIMSLFELNYLFDIEGADYWIRRAQELDCDNQQLLLLPKIYVGDHLDKYDVAEVIEKTLNRNDLSPLYSRAAISTKAEMFLRQRDWDRAQGCLDRMQAIEDPGDSWWIQWTIHTANGRQAEADEAMVKSKKSVSPGLHCLQIACGFYYTGDLERTRENLRDAVSNKVDPRCIKIIDRILWEFAVAEGIVDTGEAA